MPKRQFEEFFCFVKIFLRLYRMARGVLVGISTLILLLAVLFAYWEDIEVFNSVYFALITAMTIGYGDIVPHTDLGKVISTLIGFLGLQFFGIMIAISTLSMKKTVKIYLGEDL
ncbi:MAG: two pore domain potassium channel family protein [Chlamydiia bacterium]|nr:two pore domain potassium channel family protein [Chlamydiia bacterium]